MDAAVDRELTACLQRLLASFPLIEKEVVVSALGDSFVAVESAVGEPFPAAAERLARIRLDLHSRSNGLSTVDADTAGTPSVAADRALSS